MIADAADHPLGIGLFYQPDIHRCGRRIRNDSPGLRTNVGATQPAYIERRILQRFLQAAAYFIRARNSEELHQFFRIIRNRVENAFLFRAERWHVVVETFNDDPAVVVLHGADQMDQIHRGIRRPIPIMAAVQRELRTENSQLDGRDAAAAENQGGPAAGMKRAVENEHHVRAILFLVLRQR